MINIFNEWNYITRPAYIVAMLIPFMLPLGVGYLAALIEPWSYFWWDLTKKLFYMWIGWILICSILGWHNKRFPRIFPLIFILNAAFGLSFVILWRVTGELETMGWILFVSHLINTGFGYVYSKTLIQKSFSTLTFIGKSWLTLTAACPFVWILYVVFLPIPNYTYDMGNLMGSFGMSICFFLLNPYLVASSIKFRDPNWEPNQKSKNL
jgi:hypothetical protein